MNISYQSIWNAKTGTFVAVSENAKNGGSKAAGRSSSITITAVHFTLKSLTAAILLSAGFDAYALPVGGAVSAGSATIGGTAGTTTVTQTSQNAAINWQSFNIGSNESVKFVQPNSSAIVLNRVLGSDPSSILGSLNANGKVFLVNPNGIVFGQGASVNVAGLVGSTRNISDSDFMAGKYNFEGSGPGSIVNYGSINADGGSVALLGANVSNQGIIQAQLGTVALAAGNSMTLDVAGDGLLNVAVNKGAVDALVQNGGLIQADGGRVVMTAKSAGSLFQSTVNNTGVIRAQTLENRNGTIMLMGDMQTGTVNVAGTLDASAPKGGDGGFVETSAAHVKVASGTRITTAAPQGKTGTWLIDPSDFTIANTGGDIAATTLEQQLVNNSVVITNSPGTGNGDIFVNDAVTWTPTPTPTTLTLSANRDVVVNQAITTTGGNLTMIAGRNIDQNAAVTVTGGNLTQVAGHDVNINGMFTVTNGNVLLVGANDGTGVGTVNFAAGVLPAVTGPLSTIRIFYAPVSYATPTDFSGNFTLTGNASLNQFMWAFVQANNKVYDGNNAATLSFKGNPTLAGDVALQPGSATFDSPNVGFAKPVNYTGYSLGGADANRFALFTPFDSITAIQGTAGAGITPGNITQAPLTIIANDATKQFGETLVLATSAFTSTGLVNNETVGSVTLTSPGTVANAPVAGNPYLITASNATAGTFNPANYAINYVQGRLLIAEAAIPGSTPPGSTPPGSTPPGSTPLGPTTPGSTPPTSTIPGSTPFDSASRGRSLQAYRSATNPDVNNTSYATTPLAKKGSLQYAGPELVNANLPLEPALSVVGSGINVPSNQLVRITPVVQAPVTAPTVERPYIYEAPVYLPRQERN